MVAIKQQLVASRAKTYAGTNGRKFITIHETANTSKGADAQRHANLQTNGFSASWHWQVDDKQAIQSFSHGVRCWHAGDGKGPGNYNSIGIEICVNSDSDFKKAIQNAAKLIHKIMKDENIPIENVVQHNKWSGKNCPTNLRSGSKGIKWLDLINVVRMVGNEVEKEESGLTVKQYEELKKKVDALESKLGTDRSVSSSFVNDWEWVEDKGLLDGSRPSHPVTREQLAAVLHRYNKGNSLTGTGKQDLKDLLKKAYEEKVLTVDHSEKIDAMPEHQIINLLISVANRTFKINEDDK